MEAIAHSACWEHIDAAISSSRPSHASPFPPELSHLIASFLRPPLALHERSTPRLFKPALSLALLGVDGQPRSFIDTQDGWCVTSDGYLLIADREPEVCHSNASDPPAGLSRIHAFDAYDPQLRHVLSIVHLPKLVTFTCSRMLDRRTAGSRASTATLVLRHGWSHHFERSPSPPQTLCAYQLTVDVPSGDEPAVLVDASEQGEQWRLLWRSPPLDPYTEVYALHLSQRSGRVYALQDMNEATNSRRPATTAGVCCWSGDGRLLWSTEISVGEAYFLSSTYADLAVQSARDEETVWFTGFTSAKSTVNQRLRALTYQTVLAGMEGATGRLLFQRTAQAATASDAGVRDLRSPCFDGESGLLLAEYQSRVGLREQRGMNGVWALRAEAATGELDRAERLVQPHPGRSLASRLRCCEANGMMFAAGLGHTPSSIALPMQFIR